MAGVEDTTIECGFCWRQNEDLEKPKTLPCTHVHCFGCLTASFEINHITRCPVPDCGEVVDVPLDSLPSHDVILDNSRRCDVCADKGLGNQPAVIYCTKCELKFCIKHEGDHDAFLSKHTRVAIEEYIPQSTKHKLRECPEHKDQQLSLGCAVCLTLICVKCVAGLNLCKDGSAHKLMSLDELVAVLVEDDIEVQMIAKEEKLEKLFKLTSKVSSEYDNNTTEMLQLLRDTRDEQLAAIRAEYEKMEKELIEKRRTTRIQMAEFMDEIVLVKWTQLRNLRNQIETKLKHSHQVDIVKGMKEMKEKVQQLLDVELPELEVVNVTKLKMKGECRCTEMEINSSDGLVISSTQGVTTPSPNSLNFLAGVKLPKGPICVCHYKGSTYVGMRGSLARIDSNYQLQENFICCDGYVESVVIHKDKIYLFVGLSTKVRQISVYDMSGGKISEWSVSFKHNGYLNVLAVVSDQLVIADPPNNRVTVYSLSGQILRHLPCTLLGIGNVCLCALDNNCIVISDRSTSQIFKMNITSGETVWVCKEVNKPMGISSYGSRYILVCDRTKSLKVLDSLTGKLVKEIPADSLTDQASKYGLTTFADTLAVADYSSNQVQFYKVVA